MNCITLRSPGHATVMQAPGQTSWTPSGARPSCPTGASALSLRDLSCTRFQRHQVKVPYGSWRCVMERRKFTREFKCGANKLVKDRGVSYAKASEDLGVH